MITWITGNTGSGKTTLAQRLSNDKTVILDGDQMRSCWNLSMLKEDRIENNLRIAKIAKVLESQGFDVIVATICPYRELRRDIKTLTKCRFVYLLSGEKSSSDSPYELPGEDGL